MAEIFATAIYALQFGVVLMAALALVGAGIVLLCYIAALMNIEFPGER
jgi:hypothetical protein